MNQSFPRWPIVILFVLLLVFLSGGAWFYHTQEREMRKKAELSLSTVAQLKVDQIAAWRRERLGDATVLTQNSFLAESVALWMADQRPDLAIQLKKFFRSFQQNYHYQDVILVDLRGKALLSLAEQAAIHPSAAELVSATLRSGRPAFLNLHKDPGESEPHFSLIAPLFTYGELPRKPLAAIILTFAAHDVLYPLIQSWPTPSRTAEVLLVRLEGEDVLFLNDLRHTPNAALSLRIPAARADLPAAMAVRGLRGVVQGKDYRGVEVLAAVLPVPDSPWFLVAKEDADEVFAAWRFESHMFLALLVTAVAFLGAAGVVVRQRIQKRNAALLFEAENRVLHAKAEERQRANEVIKEREAWLCMAQDAAKAGTWEWDLRSGKNVWSDQLFRLYHLEPGCCEPSYEAWCETIDPRDRANVDGAVQAAALRGGELNMEWRVNNPGGQERWLMS